MTCEPTIDRSCDLDLHQDHFGRNVNGIGKMLY